VKVLALDLSTRLGWCVDGADVLPPRTGTYRLPSAVGGNIGKPLLLYSEWLAAMLSGADKPALVAFEAPAMGGRGIVMNAETAALLVSLAGVTEMIAEAYGVACESAHVQTVRKHFVGSGRPPNAKKAVMDRCRLLGWAVADDNAADAAAVWAYAKARRDKTFRLESTTALFGRPADRAPIKITEETKALYRSPALAGTDDELPNWLRDGEGVG
jgi:hypothetical protein